MTDDLGTNDFANQSNCSESYGDYLQRAGAACEAGDMVLGMHLYLAAYEKAVSDPDIPDGMALVGLHKAWDLACDLKERSMAEYVFEKLEPFLTGTEIAQCANELQNLALDRLEEYGFSREELQDMAEMISQDLLDGEGAVMKVESITIPRVSPSGAQGDASAWLSDGEEAGETLQDLEVEEAGSADAAQAAEEAGQQSKQEEAAAAKKGSDSKEIGMGVAPADGFNPYDMYNTSSVGMSYHNATNEGSGSYVFTRDDDRAAELQQALRFESAEADEPALESEAKPADATSADAAELGAGQPEAIVVKPQDAVQPAASNGKTPAKAPAAVAPRQSMPMMPNLPEFESGSLSYSTLVGYESAVALARDLGIGLQRDSGFKNFVAMMNSRHGLENMPALDTLLFRSPVPEDATRFVDATIGELGLPVLRMSMEEGAQGMPMLCVTTQGLNRPRMNHAHNRFEGPGVLVIDDIDMWSLPQAPEGMEGIGNFVLASMSRGAREAVNLIRSAVEDPDVFVLATATTDAEIDPFFLDLLEPVSIIDIAYPNESERSEIWNEILQKHPSMRSLNKADLLRFSAGLARYDIYMAARAALEEAYKAGLVQCMYVPVAMHNVLDKLAGYLPVDSQEYRAIEEEIIREFRDGLDDLEGLVDPSIG